MALVNGTNFDHIDLQAAGGDTTRHMLQDTQARNDITDVRSALLEKAQIDGYYEGMTVGNAEQLIATVGVQDKVPYNFRTSGGSIEIGDREVDKIIGGTVAWNQLVDENTETVTLTSGHRYAACVGGVWSIGTSNGEAISVTGGTDQLFDLTLMFGTAIATYINTLETATPGAGVAWFRALFPKDYYAYDAGTLRSVQTSAHKMVGFNAYDNETGKALVIGGSEYEITGTYTALTLNGETVTPADSKFTPAKSGELTVTGGDGTTCIHLRWDGERDGEFEPYTAHTYPLDSSLELRGIPGLDANNRLYYDGDEYDSDGTVTRKFLMKTFNGSETWDRNEQSGPAQYYLTKIGALGSVRNTICISNLYAQAGIASSNSNVGVNVVNSTPRNGAYLYVRPDNVANMTLSQFKAFLAEHPMTVVYGITATTTESAAPYQNPQYVDDFGTEQYIDAGDRDVEIPVGHDTFYRQNLRAKLETAPNSPDSSGDYLMRRSNGQNSYVPYASPLPALPAEDGTYTLKCTVSGGTAALSWESEA